MWNIRSWFQSFVLTDSADSSSSLCWYFWQCLSNWHSCKEYQLFFAVNSAVNLPCSALSLWLGQRHPACNKMLLLQLQRFFCGQSGKLQQSRQVKQKQKVIIVVAATASVAAWQVCICSSDYCLIINSDAIVSGEDTNTDSYSQNDPSTAASSDISQTTQSPHKHNSDLTKVTVIYSLKCC